MPNVAEHMSRDVLGVDPDIGLREAAKRMCDRSVGSTVVVKEGRLLGILTERDVLKAFARGDDPQGRVASLMTPDPETITSADSIDHAITLMLHGGFRHLPVVDEDELVGMISIRDVVDVAAHAPRGV